MIKQQDFSFKFFKIKKKFLKLNNFFLKKFILCSVFDPLDFNLASTLNKIKLGENNFLLISRYSRKFKIQNNVLKNLVCFSRFKNFYIFFNTYKDLKTFLTENKSLTFYFLKFGNYFSFIQSFNLFDTFKNSTADFFNLLSNFFFININFVLFFSLFK